MHPSLSQAERVRLFAGNFSGMVVMGLILLVCKQMMFQCDFSVCITLACPGFVCACLCKCASLCFFRHVGTEICLPPPLLPPALSCPSSSTSECLCNTENLVPAFLLQKGEMLPLMILDHWNVSGIDLKSPSPTQFSFMSQVLVWMFLPAGSLQIRIFF